MQPSVQCCLSVSLQRAIISFSGRSPNLISLRASLPPSCLPCTVSRVSQTVLWWALSRLLPAGLLSKSPAKQQPLMDSSSLLSAPTPSLATASTPPIYLCMLTQQELHEDLGLGGLSGSNTNLFSSTTTMPAKMELSWKIYSGQILHLKLSCLPSKASWYICQHQTGWSHLGRKER